MPIYLVRQEGSYLDTWQVTAETEDEAIAKVNDRTKENMLVPERDFLPEKGLTVTGPFETEDDINWDY